MNNMNTYLTKSIDGTLEKIKEYLLNTNGEYALAAEKCKELSEKVDPVIMSEKELTLDKCDFFDIQEYLESLSVKTTIEQHAFYEQGYIDCVKLLQRFSILR